MIPTDLEFQGRWPQLEGHTCEALVAEEYRHQGRIIDSANVVWLRAGRAWHRLTIDCGLVFWSESGTGPEAYEMPELQAEVRLRDLGHEHGLVGGDISVLVGKALPDGGVEVSLILASGLGITFHHAADRTTYYTG